MTGFCVWLLFGGNSSGLRLQMTMKESHHCLWYCCLPFSSKKFFMQQSFSIIFCNWPKFIKIILLIKYYQCTVIASFDDNCKCQLLQC